MNTNVIFDKVTILSVPRQQLEKEFITFLGIYAHPIKERAYNDTSGNNNHLTSLEQLKLWYEGGTNIYITTTCRNRINQIINIMDKEDCRYFKMQ